MSKVIITADSIGKRYGRIHVFRNISFSSSTGRSLAVTGANGSGKSTLLEIIAGIRPPSAGTMDYSFDGVPVTPAVFMETMGLAGPRVNPYEGLTGAENISFVVNSRGAGAGGAKELAARFGLAGHLDRTVKHYSTGMKQRLKIVLAALFDPPVLLLDEPGSNLDADGRAVLYSYLETVMKEKLVIIATNDPEEAKRCDGRVHLA